MNYREIQGHLRLHIEKQFLNVEDCWREGYEASRASKQESDNPYKAGTQEYQYYSDGWWAAFYGEEPIFAVQSTVNTEQVRTSNKQENNVIETLLNKVKTYKQAIVYKVFGLGAAIALAVIGYQLIDLAFI